MPNHDGRGKPTGPYAIVTDDKGYEIAIYPVVPGYAAERAIPVKVTAEGAVEVVTKSP